MPSPLHATPATAQAVLKFWFGPNDEVRTHWFQQSDAFDDEIAQRFAAEVEAALRGELDGWQATRDGGLALLLLLDQFTRNIFRGTPRAFAGDARALALARRLAKSEAGVAAEPLSPLRRWFMLLPFEHAEDLAMQEESLRHYGALAADAGPHAEALAGALDYALRHHAVIASFGRFPHRNAILGRPSTPQELEFLKQPGSRF